jgi:hypothetical protein
MYFSHAILKGIMENVKKEGGIWSYVVLVRMYFASVNLCSTTSEQILASLVMNPPKVCLFVLLQWYETALCQGN